MHLFYEKETETKARVMLMYHVTPPSELMSQAHVQVDNLPDPEDIPGKAALPYVNPQTGEFWYEYVNRPRTETEELNQKIELIQAAMDDLLMGGLM